ncbi:MAG TPA: phytanoyl-CoA dioxygenase family protein [Geminicoccaceae bacterium]|nr:phytanoyl-CoA dioxygenase family protein [Geminicoccus sp.]HMU49687.1 phytanoyl-CoA dioxygenase family protein [Geminicoccaceae bacterium]
MEAGQPAGDVVDSNLGGAYAPDLYRPTGTAELLPHVAAFGGAEIRRYREQGFVGIEQVLDQDDVQAGLGGLDDLLAGRNPDFNGVMLEKSAADESDTLRARLDRVRKLFYYVKYDTRLDALSRHPAVLSVVRALLGGREPVLFQDMALLKPPQIGREKPWHQDHAYFDLPLDEKVVGVWIALDRATIENGCMQFLAGGHLAGPQLHWMRRDWQICDTQMLGKESVACPLPPGGAVFFDSLVPHGTPQNSSPDRRRALQFHYVARDAKRVPTEERLRVFGTDGKDVTC